MVWHGNPWVHKWHSTAVVLPRAVWAFTGTVPLAQRWYLSRPGKL